jgi:hypothetical protein
VVVRVVVAVDWVDALFASGSAAKVLVSELKKTFYSFVIDALSN